MKKLSITAFMILFMISLSSGQELTGEDIIQKVNDTMNVDTSHGKAKMTIVTTSGDTRTFLQESWSKDKGEKNLVRYL
jgi:hypothetical protein